MATEARFHGLAKELVMSRQRFALPHLLPISLLSLLVLWVPVTWAQKTLLAEQTSIQIAKYAGPFAAVPEAQTHLLLFHDTLPLSFTPNLGQTGPGLSFISRGAGYGPLLPTNKPCWSSVLRRTTGSLPHDGSRMYLTTCTTGRFIPATCSTTGGASRWLARPSCASPGKLILIRAPLAYCG